MDTNLDAHLKAWKKRYSKCRKGYEGGIWNDLGNHPLDVLLDELAQMSLQHTLVQEREKLLGLFSSGFFKSPAVETWDCVLYTRRLALRLEKSKQTDLLYAGIEMLSLYWQYEDIRDSILTANFLTLRARRAGFDVKSCLDESLPSVTSEVKSLFYDSLGESDAELEKSYRWINPPS